MNKCQNSLKCSLWSRPQADANLRAQRRLLLAHHFFHFTSFLCFYVPATIEGCNIVSGDAVVRAALRSINIIGFAKFFLLLFVRSTSKIKM